MAIVRWLLARIILTVDFFFHPRGVKRDPQEQTELDRKTSNLELYQYAACPFCVKVRWSMQRNSLNVQTKDAKRHQQFAKELVTGGGQLKVPCLKIEENNGNITWMYESKEIITYLEERFQLAAV